MDAHLDIGGTRLTGDETLPGFVAFENDFKSVLLVLGLAGEGKHVFGLAVRDL